VIIRIIGGFGTEPNCNKTLNKSINQPTAVFGLVSHRKAPGSNLASWQIVWLIQAAIAVKGILNDAKPSV
jgi:hypothetical protein